MRVYDVTQFDSTSVLGKVIRWPLRALPKSLHLRVLSGPNRGCVWRVGSGTHGCWLGTYERDKAEKVGAAARPGMIAYDIGANAGYYTLLLSRAVGPSGTVVAFEPFPENVTSLLDHVGRNGLSNCRVIQAAVSSRNALTGFRPGSTGFTGSITADSALLNVPSVTLDELVRNGSIPAPDIVKMDVEGAEGAVLDGAEEILRERRATWFIALHGEAPARRCWNVLRGAGYRLAAMDGTSMSEERVIGEREVLALP